MAYATKYNFKFSNELDEVYYLYFEYLNYIGGETNINVAVEAFTLRSLNGDENKLFPILGTECLINILVGQTIDNKGVITDDSTLTVFDLIAAHDNDIRVTIVKVQPNYLQPVYQGFVVVEDNVQPFQDPPFILQIRALDGLGLLKNVDMVDVSGELYAGYITIEDWIGNILMKTGLVMNLRTYFPFYPVGLAGDGVNPLQQVYLNAITWQIGELTLSNDPSVDVFASEANDAYTALEAICRCFRCRLFQHDGVWNLVSLYTYVDPAGWSYFESTSTLNGTIYNQTLVATSAGLDLTIPVGKEDIIHPVENDATVALKLATKWVKLNYTYDQSVNKICNQNFKFGNANPTFDGTISSTIENDTITPPVTFVYKGYDVFCWTLAGGTFKSAGGVDAINPFPETAQSASSIYIRDVLDITDTTENRYLVITSDPSATNANHVRSTQFLIDINDAIEFSFDFRTHTNTGATTIDPGVAYLYLIGDDGTFWSLGGIPPSADWPEFVWAPVNGTDYTEGGGGGIAYSQSIFNVYSGVSTAEWTNYRADKYIGGGLIKAPVSGSIFIVLQGGKSGAGVESWFKNIQITIFPYLQGSYVQLKGDYNFSSSNLDIKQTLSSDVEISDSPKRYFKGALVQANGALVPPTWHRKGITEPTPTGTERFQQLMERVVYNNVYRQIQKIEGTFLGETYTLPDFTIKPSGYLNAYTFTQHPVPTKRFILTSFDRNFGTGKSRQVFVEILEDENANPFVDPFTDGTFIFQYLFN